jgi:hypothetical protein
MANVKISWHRERTAAFNLSTVIFITAISPAK